MERGRMRRFFGLVMAAALWQGPVAAAPDAVELRYDVVTAGLTSLTLRFELRNEPDRYRVAADIETRGVLGFFVPWTMNVVAQGASGGLRPNEFESSSVLYGTNRTTSMRFGRDGSIDATAVPPARDDDRDPVPPELTKGAVDVLTALLRVARQIEQSGRCDVVVPVFDGRRRYDFVFTDAGSEPSALVDLTMARRCTASVRKIAGFLKKPTPWDDSDGARAAAIVVGRLGADLPLLPVRLDMETPFGIARAELAGMRVNGVPRPLIAKN